jgi:murein L,D-transpeptidase YafK
MKLILILILIVAQQTLSFKEKQLQHQRVKDAYKEAEASVKGYFSLVGSEYANFHLFLRAFKKEGKLEVWVKQPLEENHSLLITYDFCVLSGELGPKRKEGDLQVPEGVYHINHFNPQSNFLLSLGINYPNASDKILSHKSHPGGAIYIHGNCVSIGCIPVTDKKIKELYLLAVEARTHGQVKIPVHIFPTKLDPVTLKELSLTHSHDPQTLAFWNNLKIVYQDFENSKRLHPIEVDGEGSYRLRK